MCRDEFLPNLVYIMKKNLRVNSLLQLVSEKYRFYRVSSLNLRDCTLWMCAHTYKCFCSFLNYVSVSEATVICCVLVLSTTFALTNWSSRSCRTITQALRLHYLALLHWLAGLILIGRLHYVREWFVATGKSVFVNYRT